MNLINDMWGFWPDDQYAFGSLTVGGNSIQNMVAIFKKVDDGVSERIVACVNHCQGIPTADLESKGATAGFWGRACSRLKGKNDRLHAENAALRAAVQEMARMLPVLENALAKMNGK